MFIRHFRISLLGTLVTNERSDKMMTPDNRNIFTLMALSPLPEKVVSKGN